MRREPRPGHAGRVFSGEVVNGLEPFAPLGIGLDAAGALMRIDCVEPFAGAGAARSEIIAQDFGSRAFSSHPPLSLCW